MGLLTYAAARGARREARATRRAVEALGDELQGCESCGGGRDGHAADTGYADDGTVAASVMLTLLLWPLVVVVAWPRPSVYAGTAAFSVCLWTCLAYAGFWPAVVLYALGGGVAGLVIVVQWARGNRQVEE